MGEVLKITVDDKGNVKVYENGKEVEALKRIVFSAGVEELPQVVIEKLFIDTRIK